MGVYIKGMEMPLDGRYTLCITHDSDGGVHWVIQNQDTLEFLKHGAVFVSKRKPITNADHIRNMTDEELDKFLGEVQWDVANYCGGVTQKQKYPVPEQSGAWLDWLKQEVEYGDSEL